jgi:hypothetical protein
MVTDLSEERDFILKMEATLPFEMYLLTKPHTTSHLRRPTSTRIMTIYIVIDSKCSPKPFAFIMVYEHMLSPVVETTDRLLPDTQRCRWWVSRFLA